MGCCWNPLTDSLLASLFAFFQYLRFFMHFGTYIIKKSAASKIIVIDRLQVFTFYVLIYFFIKGVIVLISIYSIMECNVITHIYFAYTWYTKLCFLMSIFLIWFMQTFLGFLESQIDVSSDWKSAFLSRRRFNWIEFIKLVPIGLSRKYLCKRARRRPDLVGT